jgi:hypothetical protein
MKYKTLIPILFLALSVGLMTACQDKSNASSSSQDPSSFSDAALSSTTTALPELDASATAAAFVQALLQKDLTLAERWIVTASEQAQGLRALEPQNYPDTTSAQMMAQMFALENQKALLRWGAVLEKHALINISVGDSTQAIDAKTKILWPVQITLKKPSGSNITPKIAGALWCQAGTGCRIWTLLDTHQGEL